jgi:hypothetical protein
MYWKGCRRKLLWFNLEVLSLETEENHENPHPGKPISQPSLEQATS